MKKAKVHVDWDTSNFVKDWSFSKEVEIFIDKIPTTPKTNVIRIIYLLEPEEISKKLYGNINKDILNHINKFDYILTHNHNILNRCKKAILFEYGTTWIKDNYTFSKKRFEVSTLVGGKLMAQGHQLRQNLWYEQNKIKIPKNFYLSGNMHNGVRNYNNNPILGNKKEPLFDSQFHIVIENVKRQNWFTEKLIDALYTKTIPIYYGCPNIEDYFDTDGMFIVNSVEEIIDICNSLTENTYNELLKKVEKNYELSKKFVSIEKRLKNKIEELI